MHNTQQPDQPTPQPSRLSQGKPMLAAMLGAIIGTGGTLHLYYTMLGGADQNQRLVQMEATMEHSRQVADATLSILTTDIQSRRAAQEALSMMTSKGAEGLQRMLYSNDKLPAKPTQQDFSDAIDGLFEALPESADSAATPASATSADPAGKAPANGHEKAPAQSEAKAVSDNGSAAASVEASKK